MVIKAFHQTQGFFNCGLGHNPATRNFHIADRKQSIKNNNVMRIFSIFLLITLLSVGTLNAQTTNSKIDSLLNDG